MATKVEPFYDALGAQIRGVRERAGLSQAELADRLSPRVTRAAIANIENAKQRVLVHMLVDMADALGVEVADLLPSRLLSGGQQLTPHVAQELARKIGEEEGQALVAKLIATRRRTGS